MSQRVDGFRGGLQSGHGVSEEAVVLDSLSKETSQDFLERIAEESNGFFEYRKSLSYEETTRRKKNGEERKVQSWNPDLGFLLHDGKVVLIAEAKSQGSTGNAHERLFRYIDVIRRFNGAGMCEASYPFSYLVFVNTTGEVQENHSIYKNLSLDVFRGDESKFNHFWINDMSIFFGSKENPFTEENIKNVLSEAIEKIKENIGE